MSSCLNYRTAIDLYTGTGIDFSCSNQGRCRVFESGPVDETIEFRKIETWESTRDPLSMVAFVRAPRRKRILTASLCVLNAFFAEFGTRFQSFFVTNFLSKMHRAIFRVNYFVFVALLPMSTAMVIAGQSVHLTTLFPGQA